MPTKWDSDFSGAGKQVVHEDTVDPGCLEALVGVLVEACSDAVALDRVPGGLASVEAGEMLNCLEMREG